MKNVAECRGTREKSTPFLCIVSVPVLILVCVGVGVSVCVCVFACVASLRVRQKAVQVHKVCRVAQHYRFLLVDTTLASQVPVFVFFLFAFLFSLAVVLDEWERRARQEEERRRKKS